MTEILTFAARNHAPRPSPKANGKPMMKWVIDPATGRPVMIWSLPQPVTAAKPIAA